MEFVPVLSEGYALKYECVHGRHIVLAKYGLYGVPYVVREIDDRGEYVPGTGICAYGYLEADWAFERRILAIRKYHKIPR